VGLFGDAGAQATGEDDSFHFNPLWRVENFSDKV
jgi:hypothetical protein